MSNKADMSGAGGGRGVLGVLEEIVEIMLVEVVVQVNVMVMEVVLWLWTAGGASKARGFDQRRFLDAIPLKRFQRHGEEENVFLSFD
ncbi:hypothetical protein D4764_21G0006620 [Takifugu flavidus]|uniref:Uncharacterized protein n=1 Tax=Takifugu flavidus TaxID=433684 RepID=A0A5C6NE64_9TELE|nr:hypothetical protein D4764_21G0006620 [Takifugu flavidus]